MNKLITSRKFLFLILFAVSFFLQSCATFREQSSVIQNPVDSLLTSNFFNSTQAGISVYDLTDNKPLYSHNEKLLLHPASNQKILTTSAAYLFLGRDYKFETGVYYSGEIKDSVCTGDIYFVGGFDPDFSLTDLDSLIFHIKTLGIKEVKGNLFADVSNMDPLFWGKGWMWDDDPYSFMPYLTPLNINKDNITVVTSPGNNKELANVVIYPKTSFLEIKNSCVTCDTCNTNVTATRDWVNRTNKIIVSGAINKSSKPDTTFLNVFNPTFYFLNLAKEKCTSAGITVDGIIDTLTLPGNTEKIFSVNRSINGVIQTANKYSDNLNAEMLLRALAYKYFGKHASAKKGLVMVDSLVSLSGFNPKQYRFVDGSGLSHYNLVSSELIAGVLKYIYYKHPEIFKNIFDSFPVSGYDGSLRNRMKNNPIYKRIHAKTGTLSGISSLSGYLESKNNHMIAFSILIQNFVGSAKQAQVIQDKLCKIFYLMN